MKSLNKAFFLIPSFVSGGAERVLVIIANEFAKRGIQTSIIVFDRDSFFYKIHDAVRVIRMDMPEVKRGGYRKYIRMPVNVNGITRILKEEKPDVVISFAYITNIIAILACRRSKIRVFVSERTDPDRYNRLQKFFMKCLYKRANGFVYQTFSIQSKYADKYGIRGSKVIYNPLTQEQIGEKKQKEKIIISVGRLIPEKNHEMLIKAFAETKKLNDFVLDIYGEGPLKEKLTNLIKDLEMEGRIKLCGLELDAIKKHNEAAVFVLPSYVEGFPNALIEAMANGIVCVASDIESGVIREIIKDKENGYLFSNKNQRDLREKLEMASMESNANDTIRENARNVFEDINVEAIIDKWIDYIEYG